MKLKEIQGRCASEMHVNVTIDCCFRAKKIVKKKMVENHELRSKIPWARWLLPKRLI
ncbi:hypothetical protein Goshw_023822 [Gossypium schwendimanii]|uniref:Uncharacterized protein n=1 Tax=Gossypium schwendimanii TaxID=34291 RepID=A0A7J9LBV6_GOSSC|nr:hypothetical protein [Gossypium schwendimanii]